MIPGFGWVVDALAIVLGVLWCKAMYGRWRSHLFRLQNTTKMGEIATIAALWGVTLAVVCIVISTSIGIVREISGAV